MAQKWGRPEIAEDLAQEAVIQQLRYPGLDIEYALVDLLRKEYGSSRTLCGRARQIGSARAIRLDAPCDDSDAASSLNHELVGNPEPDPRLVEPARDFSYLFRGSPREPGKRGRSQRGPILAQIYRLSFEEELSPAEIGKILGMTEGNVSMALCRIRKRIMLEAGLDQVREVLEEDPGITRLEIDWITI